MKIVGATHSYEKWLAELVPPVTADLRLKHAKMADPHSPFLFLRATFYRWVQQWESICPDLAELTPVLAVGDLHVENFGTWRDAEGRLAWGVNDFDETCELAFANDLVRLAVSAILSTQGDRLSIDPHLACESIISGYKTGIDSLLEGNAHPVVIDERHRWFEPLLGDRRPDRFWQRRREEIGLSTDAPPAAAKKILNSAMPAKCDNPKFARRVAGVGSLGRPRFFTLADWHGGPVAREAKALLPSAAVWAGVVKPQTAIAYQAILNQAVRCPDPFLAIQDNWIVRRLAPDSGKVELTAGGRATDAVRLLHAMGYATALTHAPGRDVLRSIRKELKKLDGKPFRASAAAMLESTRIDWQQWKQHANDTSQH